MRFLGIDYGHKYIGIAVSDPFCRIASPLKVLENHGTGDFINKLKELIKSYDISRIVIGLPYNLDGTLSEFTIKTKAFADVIGKNIGLPIVMWDERYISKSVEKMLIDADISRKKRKKIKDKLEAALILQTYLDSNND